jgi:dual-specificity kinase
MLRSLKLLLQSYILPRPRLECKPSDMIGPRYRVIDGPFEGGNGTVYICCDLETRNIVAIKAFMALAPSREAGERESRALQLANKHDPGGDLFLRHIDTFTYFRHFCLVFERYGISLFEALSARDWAPLPVRAIRSVMCRIVRSVRLLHDHGLIHTDIKPENILLPPGFDLSADFDRPPIRVKLIDFDAVAAHNTPHTHLAATRYYRAPEIIMGIKWGPSCDIWSLGCLLADLALGHPLFDIGSPVAHLFLVQQMIGPLPASMTEKTTHRDIRNAFRDGRIDVGALPRELREEVMAKQPITGILQSQPELCDLLLKMLIVDPSKRLSPADILQHNFLACGEDQ